MKRTAAVALVFVVALGGCAGARTRSSHTPKTVVVVKGATKKAVQADYRVSPEESRLTGSGGTAK